MTSGCPFVLIVTGFHSPEGELFSDAFLPLCSLPSLLLNLLDKMFVPHKKPKWKLRSDASGAIMTVHKCIWFLDKIMT